MLIYHWIGQGFNQGVREYIQLEEDLESFMADYASEQEAIEASTAPGFDFERKYDTNINDDFSGLPMGQSLTRTL